MKYQNVDFGHLCNENYKKVIIIIITTVRRSGIIE